MVAVQKISISFSVVLSALVFGAPTIHAQAPPPPPLPTSEAKSSDAKQEAKTKKEVKSERLHWFQLYPPSDPGTVRPSMPPPSTSTRYPDLFAPRPRYEEPFVRLQSGAFDLRYRSSRNQTSGTYLAAGRMTVDWIHSDKVTGEETSGFRAQLLLEPVDLQSTGISRLRSSELYVFRKVVLPIEGLTGTVRVGQFVLPFGLIAVYDTPLQPIQPLYEEALGLRVDTGILFEGHFGNEAGKYRYAASLTTGRGPNKLSSDIGGVTCFRIERNFNGDVRGATSRVQIGASILTGRLPLTQFNTELPASGTVTEKTMVNKTRFAIDGQIGSGNTIGRGEVIFGGDSTASGSQEDVGGYFLEGNQRLGNRLAAVTEIKWWRLPVKPQGISVLGAGLNYSLGRGVILQTLYEYERQIPLPAGRAPIVNRRFIIQTRLTF